MNKRTRKTAIPTKVKKVVWERDGKCCIFCGRPGNPEAHIIPRSHGGLGIEQNIVTVCRECHDLLDNSTERDKRLQIAKEYVRSFYPGWTEESVIYNKWEGFKYV